MKLFFLTLTAFSLISATNAYAEKFGCYAIKTANTSSTVDFSEQKVLFKGMNGRFTLLKGDSDAPLKLTRVFDEDTDAAGKTYQIPSLAFQKDGEDWFSIALGAHKNTDMIATNYGDYVRVYFLKESDLSDECAIFSGDFNKLGGVFY